MNLGKRSVLISLVGMALIGFYGCADGRKGQGLPLPESETENTESLAGGKYTKTFTSEDDFALGIERGVNHTANPGKLQMTANRSTFDTPFVWVANSLDNTVSQIDTKTGEVTRTVTLEKGGKKCVDPSRTAVNADNDVWIACRGSANIVKVNHQTGEVMMIVDLEGIPRGMAVDANSKLWVGCGFDGAADDPVYKIDEKTGDCLIGNRAGCAKPAIMVADWPYGAAVDQKGFLWMLSNHHWSDGTLTKIDTTTDAVVGKYKRTDGKCACFYGIAIDQLGDIWTGNAQCDDVLKFEGATGKFLGGFGSGGAVTRGVAVDLDGNVWVANSSTSTISKIHGATGNVLLSVQVGKVVEGATTGHPIGAAVDSMGHVWAVNYATDEVIKINGLTQEMQRIPVGRGPYTYSDMMGTLLNTVTLRRDNTASWIVNYDAGTAHPSWKELKWKAFTSGGTRLRVRARCAAEKAGLATAQWSPYLEQPGPLACASERWVQLEAQFFTPNKAYTPILEELSISWED